MTTASSARPRTTSRDFNENVSGERTRLAAQLKQAAATTPETEYRHGLRTRTAASTVSEDKTKKFEKIAENPFFEIAGAKEKGLRLPNEKRDAMIKLLAYDQTKSAAENETMAQAFMTFLEYMEEQSLQSSKANIAGQNAKVFAELAKVIDEFSRGLMDFKTEIGPFTRRLESIYNIRLSGKAVDLLTEIIEDRKAIEQNKVLLGEQTATLGKHTEKLEELNREISGIDSTIADLGTDYRFGIQWFGIKSSSNKALAQKRLEREYASKDSDAASSEITSLQSAISETQEKLGSPVGTKFGELAADKAELAGMLDISSEDHVTAHENLKKRTLSFIETSEERIDAVLGNVEEVNGLTGKTARKNGAMVIVGAIMNEAVKEAMNKNQATLGEYEPPADPATEDEITKAEREETRGSVLRHIKSITVADDSTTKLRNSLTRQKDNLENMLQANEERIRATRQLRTSGISNMASEMAITMTALADAANAEALHMSQSMVDEMGKTVIDIRSKEVMRQAAEMGIRNQQLAELIVSTQQADRIARIGIDEQRKALTQLNKNLAGVTDVTADLQATLKANEAVYAEAQAAAATELEAEGGPHVPSNDDVPPKRVKPAAGGPAPDLFG